MNKKIAVAVAALVAFASGAAGAANMYTTNLVNEKGLAFNNNYALNLSTTPNAQSSLSALSAQIVYSSASPTIATYNGGQTATATITVVSTAPLVAAFATDKITVTPTLQLLAAGATAQITVSSSVPKAVITINGNTLREGIEWIGVGVTSQTAAANIATAINTYLASTLIATAPFANTAVIYTTATNAGVLGNAYTVTSSTPFGISTGTLAAPFNGGRDRALYNAWIEFNGDRSYNGLMWTDASNTSTGTAISIAAWLNNFGVIKASTGTSGTQGVVFATSTLTSSAANAFTLKTSTSVHLAVGSANFVNGQDSATVTINGTVLTISTFNSVGFFAIGASTAATAINLSSAIVNNPTLKLIVVSTETGNGLTAGIVYTTSTGTGFAANYTIVTSTPALLATNGRYFGGSNSSSTINSAMIAIASHGFTTGMQVYQSTGSAVQLKPLVWGTTYFVMRIDDNNLALATSLANAVAGSSITITSSSTLTTAPTFTLTPLAIAGTSVLKWQVSNNGVDWTDLATPAPYSIGSFVFPSTSTVIDFGSVNYQQIRLNVTAPTAGGLGLKVPVNGKL